MNDHTSQLAEQWSVDDLMEKLWEDQKQHGLQCAYELQVQFPDDIELQLAGLVHDVAHRVTSEAMHGIVGAEIIRPMLGNRVAELVELHVDAKRYLVTVDPTYRSMLSPVSIHTLELQGGDMNHEERLAFETNPHALDAMKLRRADEAAKVDGREVPGLDHWEPILRASVEKFRGSATLEG